jgi:arabinogalactan oligomer / maltooligosaccharide transport system permease protein
VTNSVQQPQQKPAPVAPLGGKANRRQGRSPDRSGRNFWRALPYLGVALVVLAAVTFYPIVYGIWMAFYNISLSTLNNYQWVGLKNFMRVLAGRNTEFYPILGRTAIWTVINVAAHVVIGTGLAILLQRPGVRFRSFFKALFILPWAVPSYITVLAWKSLVFDFDYGYANAALKGLHLAPISWLLDPTHAFWATVLVNVWLGVPFMLMVASGALQSIPGDLYESAELDGASSWAQIRHITLPMLRPIMTPTVILGTIWTFNNFNAVYLLTGGGPYGSTDLVITYVYRVAFGSSTDYQYSQAAALSLIIFVLLLLLVLLYLRVTREEE